MPRFHGFVVAALSAGVALVIACASRAAAPSDFDLVANTAGRFSGSRSVSLHIDATGLSSYAVYLPDSVTAGPLDSLTFVLSGTQLGQLWQAITTNGFYSLASAYGDTTGLDGSVATLTIRGNGTTATVTTRNLAVAGFDAIVTEIDALTPGGRDLVHDIAPPDTFTPNDGCGNTAPTLPAKPAPAGLAGLRARAGRSHAAGEPTQPPRSTRPRAVQEVDPPDFGTTVGYHISLADAVARGIATLTSKGDFFGDQVSITVDNTPGYTTNDLRGTLNLQYYGRGATGDVADFIKGSVEGRWNGFKVGGVDFNVEVNGVVTGSLTPLGTAGYHQVKLDSSSVIPVSEVRLGDWVNNPAQADASWHIDDSEAANMYAHEVGHLFGLPDRYTGYVRHADGNWAPEDGGAEISVATLASMLAARNPGHSAAQITNWLQAPGNVRAAYPNAGAVYDIMGRWTQLPLQSDINAIVGKAGLIVDVSPGQVFLNKNRGQQNLVSTRGVHMFVPKGQVRTINGLWTACIDLSKEAPDAGTGFDLGPPLTAWTGSPAAAAMQKLLNYVDAKGLYCANDLESQFAVWDLSESDTVTPPDDSTLFAAAGVALPLPTGFPHLSDPNFSGASTQLVNPHELYAPGIVLSTPVLTHAGASVGLSTVTPIPSGGGITSTLAWSLQDAPGSTASLSATTGATSGFHPDAHGTYRVLLHTHVVVPPDSFDVDTLQDVVAGDSRMETFESGTLRTGAPFFWKSAGDSAWAVATYLSHSGSFGAYSPYPAVPSATLASSVTLGAPGPVQFAYGVVTNEPGSALRFLVDGVVKGTWANTTRWELASFTIPAGTHTLTWNLLSADTLSGDVAFLDDVAFPTTAQLLDAPAAPEPPAVVRLAANEPNPVTTATWIPFSLPRAGHVRIVLYDLLGRVVAVPADGDFEAGEHRVRFDASALPPGMYRYQLTSGSFRASRALVHVR